MGQIAQRGALRLKLETHAAIPQCVCVCGNGSDGGAALTRKRSEDRRMEEESAVGEVNDGRNDEKD